VGVARSHLQRGDEAAALAALDRDGQQLNCEGWLLLAQLQRRRGNWGAALPIWEALAGEGNLEALERLAKFHEHQRRDYDAAARYVERLLLLAPDPRHWHRHQRLQSKRVAESARTHGGQRAAPSPPPAPLSIDSAEP
jgi:tetratricopeptide (TPR) repeat protein